MRQIRLLVGCLDGLDRHHTIDVAFIERDHRLLSIFGRIKHRGANAV